MSNNRTLARTDLANAARDLEVPLAAAMAVVEIESRGNGFLPTGEPTILFERHIMHRMLRREGRDADLLATHLPGIINPSMGGYSGGRAEHQRLHLAKQISIPAAIQSASWGLFQIMGFNHKAAGFDTPQAFEAAMQESESQHLRAFINFIKAHPRMHRALQQLNWTEFARLYNGPAFARNSYDVRIATAFERHNRAGTA